MRLFLVFLLCPFLAACGATGLSGSPATAGVTTGGAQDIGLARRQVAAGRIPQPSSVVIEGLLSEHDIDVNAPPCARLFCLNPAVGIAPAFDSDRDAAFVVLGMSSNIKLNQFQREPLNVSVVVDKSGSMTGARIAAARTALQALIKKLRPGDRLSLVTFNHNFDVVVPSFALNSETTGLRDIVDEIEAGGSTNIESALAEGFRQVHAQASAEYNNRVILITDARPNTGRTDSGSFLELTRTYADWGIGLTVMGVGLDFGQDLILKISQIHGGNYVFLESHRKLARVFDRDFDFLVTPVAWDLEIVVEPLPGYRIVQAYGVPSWTASEGAGTIRIHVPTLFLSRNRGAIVLQMEPVAKSALRPGRVGQTLLGYRLHRTAAPHRTRADIIVPHDHGLEAHQAGVQKAVALVNTGLGLKKAITLAHRGRYPEALQTLQRVDRLVDGSDFTAERKLVAGLRQLIQRRVRETVDTRREEVLVEPVLPHSQVR